MPSPDYDDCPFCCFFDEGATPIWRTLFGEQASEEMLFQTQDFAVLLDTAPIRSGHILIVPKQHIASLAARPNAQFEVILDRARKTVSRHYDPPTIFEHGALNFSRNAGACVDHAHLHLVPGNYAISDRMRHDYPLTRQYQNITDLFQAVAGSPYVMCGDPGGQLYAAEAPRCTSQYLRRLVTAEAKVPARWNWRDCIRWAESNDVRQEILDASKKYRS